MVELRKNALPSRRARVLGLCAGLVLAAHGVFADTIVSPPALSFTLEPGATIPVGPGAAYFLPGASARVGAEYALPPVPMLSLGASVIFGLSPIAAGLGNTLQVGGMLDAGWRFPVFDRLSARAFAGVGPALGTITGDPSSAAVMLVGEAGVGLSWLLNPSAALRLDGSWFSAFGGSGGIAVSLGVLLRPWPGAVLPVAENTPRTGLRIEGVVLDPVYPALGHFYDNHPVGKVVIRNTGRGSAFELRVRSVVGGLAQGTGSSASRAELKPGESWEAPLSMDVGVAGKADAGAAAGASADPGTAPLESQVLVTFVEGGELWELRSAAPLVVQASHLISADDPRGAVSFVLPADPALGDLSRSLTEAIGPGGGSADSGRAVRGIFAARSALRLLGLRVTPDAAGQGGSTKDTNATGSSGSDSRGRRLKYPAETLRDRSGTSGDIAVLCASLLEAVGIRAALIQASGRLFVGVEAGASDDVGPVLPPAGSLISVDARSWIPMDTAILDGTFGAAVASGVRSWSSGSALGSGNLVPVRELSEQYPPSPPPGATPAAPGLPGDLRARLKAVVAAFLDGRDPAGLEPFGSAGAASAKPPARRLLVVLALDAPGSWQDLQRMSLADSLALALGRPAAGVVVIPNGAAAFPGPPEERRKAARDKGADCYLVVSIAGGPSSPVVSAELDDLLAPGGRGATRVGPVPLPDSAGAVPDAGPAWGPVVSLVNGSLGTGLTR